MIYGFELLFFCTCTNKCDKSCKFKLLLYFFFFFFFQVEMDNERIFETMVYKVKVMEH